MKYEELVERLRSAESNYQETLDCLSEAADAIEEMKKVLNTVQDAHNEGYDVGYWAGRRDYEPKWIPVTERLPEKGKKVLVFAYGNDVFTAMLTNRAENNNPVFECNKSFLEIAKPGRITHWMPLPEPPKEETE